MFKFKNNILTLGASDVYIFNNLLRIKGVCVWREGEGPVAGERGNVEMEGGQVDRVSSQPRSLVLSTSLQPHSHFSSSLLLPGELRLHLKGLHSLKGRVCP